MKVTFKYALLFLCLLLELNQLNAQRKPTIKRDTVYIERNAPVNQADYETKINELQREIADLSKTIGDTKQSFYDSKLNAWNFIVTAIGLVLLVFAYLGFRNISDLRQEINKDSRDFRAEQNGRFENFVKESDHKIQKGLDNELRQAIKKVMKGTFEEKINDIADQVAKLAERLDKIVPQSAAEQTTPTAPNTIEPEKNLFDE